MASEHFDHSQIPEGWTADPVHLKEVAEEFPRENYDIDAKSTLQAILSNTGPSPERLLSCPAGTYFVWNELSSVVLKIVEPKKLDDIIPKLGDPAWKGIDLVKVKPTGGPAVLGKFVKI